MTPVRIDIPQPGFYQMRLVKGGVFVAVRIWWGFPSSLEPEETTDRTPSWHAERDGQEVPVDQVWPDCSNKPIPEWEHRYMLARAAHARAHDPASPFADPRRPVDLNKAPLPVFKKR